MAGSADKGTATARAAAAATPMMAQYWEIKSAHPDYLLFFRMGDFYELFFEDAEKAAETLAITLTKRGKHQGEEIPMCGVPVHSAETYLEQLIRAGFKVAVCEQMEDPAEAKKRGPKTPVRREVIRLVTAGTLTEDTLLDARTHNYLCAVNASAGRSAPGTGWGMAWLDISTGDFAVMELGREDLGAQIARLDPQEVLVPDRVLSDEAMADLASLLGTRATPLPAIRFQADAGALRLKEMFEVAVLDGFGAFSRAELAAAGALVDYVALTQKGHLPALKAPRRDSPGHAMALDSATRANLELVRTLSGERTGSLLSVLDRTVTGPGARELARRLSSPLTDPVVINRRLDAVSFFVDGPDLRGAVRDILKRTPDLARALARLTVGRGGPRDLAAIRDGLAAAGDLHDRLEATPVPLSGLGEEIADHVVALGTWHRELVGMLTAALGEDLPVATRDGGFIAKGYHDGLEDARSLRDESRRIIAGLQERYQKQAGVKSLKVKQNNVLGYFIEVPDKAGEAMMRPPLSETFIHRQTTASALRFTTIDLSDLEARIKAAGQDALAIEMEIFNALLEEVCGAAPRIGAVATALAALDVAVGLSVLAEEQRYVRPLIDDGRAFDIEGGRHPVVEAALARASANPFIANDCDLSAEGPDGRAGRRLWLVTGPNMAGKSTFLRQNALIAIMAQMGGFVPAARAHIGIVDRLFSRVGAADDLARGRSTFMVEMVETAAILNQAGPRSLVILDEIGRGTATFDGLSIAWATLEHLHDVNGCRGLFATHYHELTALAKNLAALGNLTMKVKEWNGEVVFLHEVVEGAADRSYGIQVAKLAGLPQAVITRAGAVLAKLEDGRSQGKNALALDDLPLFSALETGFSDGAAAGAPSPAEDALRALDPDEFSPREALAKLYELKKLT
ncbi:MAG: DNA mismatch repair protein MutS [Alphaproteobacteria bacterium]